MKLKDFIIYTFIFILGLNFGHILMSDNAYNFGLKVGKCVRQLIERR